MEGEIITLLSWDGQQKISFEVTAASRAVVEGSTEEDGAR